MPSAIPAAVKAGQRRRARRAGSLYRRIVLKLFEPMQQGYLRMILPDGVEIDYGAPDAELQAVMQIRSEDFFKRCALKGDIGFGEAFVDGLWDTDDITKVIEWMILNVENHPTLMAQRTKSSPVDLFKVVDNFSHLLRANTVKGSRKNISAHYDLGNDFFRLFLDPGMTYSAAYYRSQDFSLEEAQSEKYEQLCRKLKLHAKDHVLEIGGGWGGFAEHAARRYGCKVTSITVSREQFAFAESRIRNAGLSDRVEFQLTDYRHVKGLYDKIVSIEMIEAVGHRYLQTYFERCHALLKAEGLLGLQMILAPDHRYESFRKKSDWIQKHIFPGGLLPSFDAIHQAVRKTGDLGLLDYEDMTPHYVRTLAAWREALNRNREGLFSLGFNETFRRKWNYYFSYCEAAFSMRNISVAQVVFSRPNNHSL